MINYIWFTSTENYAERDALFYFFLTAWTSQEHESSCGAMPGGLTFPGFSFTQQKFHSPSKPMGFLPSFISQGLERSFFNLYFLGGVGVSVSLLQKWNGCYSMILSLWSRQLQVQNPGSDCEPASGSALALGMENFTAGPRCGALRASGGPAHPASALPAGQQLGALPEEGAEEHCCPRGLPRTPKSRPGDGPGCPQTGQARAVTLSTHSATGRSAPCGGSPGDDFNFSPCHGSWRLWVIWFLTRRSWCKSQVRGKEIPAASLGTPCQAWGWQSCSPWTASARVCTSNERHWRGSGPRCARAPALSPPAALAVLLLPLLAAADTAPRDAAGRSAPSPRSSQLLGSEPTHGLQGTCV